MTSPSLVITGTGQDQSCAVQKLMVTGLIRSGPGLDRYQRPGNRSQSGLLKKWSKDRTGQDLKALAMKELIKATSTDFRVPE
jgi:hypothetical protein